MKEYRVGIYARLSRDDERQGESVSIENQKEMLLRRCAQEESWRVVDIFIDDGWSGTNFDRPGFCRLMEAVRAGDVNLVLVKDLSRLGRDYIQVGTYMDCIFPYYHCRFVALNDGIDTLRQESDISVIFKNVMNDIYARDTSKKIRAVRRSGAESGKFMGYKAPYGYVRAKEDKHRFLVDPEAAAVVKRIFSMRTLGCAIQHIADDLNQEKILTPRDYTLGTRDHQWRRETVRAILCNEAYIGNMVQMKQGRISYKDRRQQMKPREEWVRVVGTHAAIIERDVWDKVRELDERKEKPLRRNRGRDPLALIMCCGICGKPLRKVVNHKKRGGGMKEYTYYICGGHTSIPKGAAEEILEQEILSQMRLIGGRDLKEKIEDAWMKDRRARMGQIAETRKKRDARIRELTQMMCKLYEDMVKGELEKSSYKAMMSEYEAEQLRLEKSLEGDKDSLVGSDVLYARENDLCTLSCERELWVELIERVEIGRKERGAQDIRIFYRFKGVS